MKEKLKSSNKKELLDSAKEYAKLKKIKLNPNEKILNGIIKALMRNKEFKGEAYCPCRIITGNKEKDEGIICPCIYHEQEIKELGHCKCNLFFK
jgi:ferredoxin-thioredoxin reductase catalytic chain